MGFCSINRVEKFPLEWFSTSVLSNIYSIFFLSLCANNSKWYCFWYLDLGWNVTWLGTFVVMLCIPKSYKSEIKDWRIVIFNKKTWISLHNQEKNWISRKNIPRLLRKLDHLDFTMPGKLIGWVKLHKKIF